MAIIKLPEHCDHQSVINALPNEQGFVVRVLCEDALVIGFDARVDQQGTPASPDFFTTRYGKSPGVKDLFVPVSRHGRQCRAGALPDQDRPRQRMGHALRNRPRAIAAHPQYLRLPLHRAGPLHRDQPDPSDRVSTDP